MYLNSCCCGCSLRTTTLALGCLDFIVTVLLTVYCKPPNPDPLEALKELSPPDVVRLILFIIVVVRVIGLIFLIIGIYKGRSKLIFPWVILNFVYVLATIVTFSVIGTEKDTAFRLLAGMLLTTLELYFSWLVLSFYKEMQTNEKFAKENNIETV